MRSSPSVVMGTIYIGGMQLRYDISGGTVVKFSDGAELVVLPDPLDVGLHVQAEAMGYGRQIGILTRDRVLMHCLLADVEGTEPTYLREGRTCWPNRVDALVCHLNGVQAAQQPWGEDDAMVLTMAYSVLGGGGYSA